MSKTARLPLHLRIRYAFRGYKMQNFRRFLRKKAPKYALIILLILSFCYLSLHPIHQLKVKYFFTRSCTIEVTVRGHGIIPSKTVSTVLIDGDWIRRDSSSRSTYYKVEDGVQYRYYQDDHGEWQRKATEIQDFDVGAELLDRSNYTREKGSLFVWRLNADVAKKIDDLSNIRLKSFLGEFAIVGEFYSAGYTYEVTISFTKFGLTHIKPPVKD